MRLGCIALVMLVSCAPVAATECVDLALLPITRVTRADDRRACPPTSVLKFFPEDPERVWSCWGLEGALELQFRFDAPVTLHEVELLGVSEIGKGLCYSRGQPIRLGIEAITSHGTRALAELRSPPEPPPARGRMSRRAWREERRIPYRGTGPKWRDVLPRYQGGHPYDFARVVDHVFRLPEPIAEVIALNVWIESEPSVVRLLGTAPWQDEMKECPPIVGPFDDRLAEAAFVWQVERLVESRRFGRLGDGAWRVQWPIALPGEGHPSLCIEADLNEDLEVTDQRIGGCSFLEEDVEVARSREPAMYQLRNAAWRALSKTTKLGLRERLGCWHSELGYLRDGRLDLEAHYLSQLPDLSWRAVGRLRVPGVDDTALMVLIQSGEHGEWLDSHAWVEDLPVDSS
ncbi:MAG: hypothetical protein AAF533_25800 [Acidobacteriota bacterium]